MRFWILSILLISSAPRFCAAQTTGDLDLYLGAGALFENTFAKQSADPTGRKNIEGTFYPDLLAAARFQRWDFHFVPEFTVTLPGRADMDGSTTRYLSTLSGSIEKDLSPFDARLGAGILFTLISGHGETKILNNGNGTETFYQPDSMSLSNVFMINSGIGCHFDRYRIDLDGVLASPLSTRRGLSLILSFAVGLQAFR